MIGLLFSISDESDHYKIKYIYDHYKSDMLKLSQNKLKNANFKNYKVDAEDAVSEAFLKIAKHIRKINFDLSENELKTYVLTIAANETYNLINRTKFTFDYDELQEEISYDDEDFFTMFNIKYNYNKIVEYVKEMNEAISLTLYYYYHHQMKIKDIASLFNVSTKAIYARLSKGKDFLIEKVKSEEQYE